MLLGEGGGGGYWTPVFKFFMSVPSHFSLVTSIVQRSVFVQSEERRVEKHSVVVLHDDPLVLCLDPWFVLIG